MQPGSNPKRVRSCGCLTAPTAVPVDATKNYIRGIPVFATLIALEEHGRVRIGVVSAPALHQRWWAVAGQGAVNKAGRYTVVEGPVQMDGNGDFNDC